jgi:hypothetical protein
VSNNGYFGNTLMMWKNIIKISLCHIGMMWKIFFHVYMDESHKMDDFFMKVESNELFG